MSRATRLLQPLGKGSEDQGQWILAGKHVATDTVE